MSTATAPILSKAKAKKEREKKLAQSQEDERLKTVVRRLPPNLPEDVFWQGVQSWVTEETTTWKAYSPGKLRKKLYKENIPSRAYIAFKTEEQVALFSREYDGHIFRDKNGVESQAVIEFAPYQKIPPEKKKVDGRNGTIEKDEDYISFLESLKASETAEPVSLETLIASTQPAPLPKTTPLLEALKAEKTAIKDKEAITRNHAHYKQVEVATHKEDRKKSTAATRSEAQVANPSLAGGKKAAKKVQAQAQAAASKASMPNKNESTNGPLATHQTSLAGSPSSSSRPPKQPKALRPAQQGKPTSTALTSGTTATHNANTSSVASIDRAASASTPRPDNSSSTPSRRTRPIIGIASRQFEAALSTAGLANSASERRKREKDKPKDIQTPTTESVGEVSNPSLKNVHSDGHNHSPLEVTSAMVDTPDSEKGKAAAPPSPKKDKSRRGGAGRVVHPALNATPVIVPRILQRDDGSSPAAPVNNTPNTAPSNSGAISPSPIANVPPSSILGGGQPRGGRRGRGGGGRGRGGPPRGGS